MPLTLHRGATCNLQVSGIGRGPTTRDDWRNMDDRRLLRIGIVGTVVAAVCCFTPLLVGLLAVVGLSAVVGWLDYALLPALAIFGGITVYALIRQRRGRLAGS